MGDCSVVWDQPLSAKSTNRYNSKNTALKYGQYFVLCGKICIEVGIIPQNAHKRGIIKQMALITQTQVESRLGRQLTTDEANSFDIINQSAQTYVERMLGSSVESVSPSTRYYDGGVQYLEIDPCTAITDVKYVDASQVTESTLLATDYTTEPVNRTLKTLIRARYNRFNWGINNVAVTAKFSVYDDSQTLSIVKNALLDMLVQVIDGKESVSSESIEGYSVSFDKLTPTVATKALETIRQGII